MYTCGGDIGGVGGDLMWFGVFLLCAGVYPHTFRVKLTNKQLAIRCFVGISLPFFFNELTPQPN